MGYRNAPYGDTDMLRVAGYIATNRDRTAIFGIGKTEDDARADAVRESGVLSAFPDTNTIEEFPTFPATQGLIDYVADHGGAYISWGNVGGIACTDGEENEE